MAPMADQFDKLQRYTFDKVGDGYQFTTTTDGLWVMAKDVERLERELAEAIERERLANMRADQAEEARDAAVSASGVHPDTTRMDFMERFIVEGTWPSGEHGGKVAWLADAQCLRETIDVATDRTTKP